MTENREVEIPQQCTGEYRCTAPVHVHGCYAERTTFGQPRNAEADARLLDDMEAIKRAEGAAQ